MSKNYVYNMYILPVEQVMNAVPIIIVYTPRSPNKIHVISARKLMKAEERQLVKELNLEARTQKSGGS